MSAAISVNGLHKEFSLGFGVRKRKGLDAISELAARVRAIQAQDARVPPLPKGLGTAISERFGIPPSPALGELMRVLKVAVDDGLLDAQMEPSYYLDHLAAQGLVPSPPTGASP